MLKIRYPRPPAKPLEAKPADLKKRRELYRRDIVSGKITPRERDGKLLQAGMDLLKP